jgi:hypothetical protein
MADPEFHGPSGLLECELLINLLVKGIVDWNVSSPERGERSIGSASFALEVPANAPRYSQREWLAARRP